MPTEEELAEANAAAAEARLAALAGGPTDPPAEPEPEPELTDPPAEPEPEPRATAPDEPAASDLPPPPAPRRGARTLEDRIGSLTRDKRTLAQRNAELEQQLAAARASSPAPTGEPPPAPAPGDTAAPQRHEFRTQAEFNAAVQAEAARQASLARWNEQCNAVEDKGAKFGPRWQAAKASLALLDDNGVIPYDILSVALETEAPERVILALGEDPDRADELLRMTPVKRAMEIAKMSTGPTTKTPSRSAAPPPVDPLRGRGAPVAATTPSDRDSDDEWLRKRNAEIEAKRIAEAARLRSMS